MTTNGPAFSALEGQPHPLPSLDVTGIPRADEFEQRLVEKERTTHEADAKRLIHAVRSYLENERRHQFDPVGRGGAISPGGLALANESLAPLGWVVRAPTGLASEVWTLGRLGSGPTPRR